MSKTKTTVKNVTDWILHLFVARGEPLICGECKEPMLPTQRIHWDHIHGEALGGAHHYLNQRPMHAACNLKKGGRETRAHHKINRILGITGNGPSRKIPPRPFPKVSRPMQSGKNPWPKREFQKRVKV